MCRHRYYNNSYVAIELLDFIILQGGSYDCGLFAIAFATALAHGMDPVECFFDQRKLRRHLYQCLVAGKLTPFPQAANRPASKRAVASSG